MIVCGRARVGPQLCVFINININISINTYVVGAMPDMMVDPVSVYFENKMVNT